MNEEELKKEINVGISYTNPNRVWKAIGDLEDLSFQKGKLEQKKEDNNILIKYSKLRLYRSKSCQLLIKQLQKEIGGMKNE